MHSGPTHGAGGSLRCALAAPFILVSASLAFGGCSGSMMADPNMEDLPMEPAPWGFPSDQVIEGGLQARITKPGVEKLMSVALDLIEPSLTQPTCLPGSTANLLVGTVGYCNGNCGGGSGCPITITLRPDLAPPRGIAISVPDSPTKPIVHVDAAFDVGADVPVFFDPIFGGPISCTLRFESLDTHIEGDIGLGIDPQSGKLTLSLETLDLKSLNLESRNCGLISTVVDFVLDIVDSFATSTLGRLVTDVLRPQISSALAGLLPDPPGLAQRLLTSNMLASMNAPDDAALEMLLVAGGYVSSKSGGLNIGVMAGLNSDRDVKTRGAALVSEPSLCVPARPAPDLRSGIWNLPSNPARKNFRLEPAPEFSGNPDPKDSQGKVQDIALGVSKSFLNLAGFHAYSSGTLCLALSGGVLSALNVGAVSVLVPSLANITSDRRAPVAIALRPQQAPVFTLGAGGMADPLLKIGLSDLRVDFYGFIEERFVRLFTLGLDLNVGLDLTVTMDDMGRPALQPVLTGIDQGSVTARATNTDLLQEEPRALAGGLVGLIDLAIGQVTGAIGAVPLPEIQGFSIEGLQIERVQTNQDDFFAIFGTLARAQGNPPPAPAPDGLGGRARRAAVATSARIVDIDVPPAEVIRAAAIAGTMEPGSVPTVTLEVSGSGIEWSYRVDGGAWSPWRREARSTLVAPAFLLQGRHDLDVRARMIDEWSTEDPTPARFEIVIDSVGPLVTVEHETDRLQVVAVDDVSDPGELRYTWLRAAPDGDDEAGLRWVEPSRRSFLYAREVDELTHGARLPLALRVIDAEGNAGELVVPPARVAAFLGIEPPAGTASPSATQGLGCSVGSQGRLAGGSSGGAGALALLVGLVMAAAAGPLRRRRASM